MISNNNSEVDENLSYEINKSEVLERFYNRPKVQLYMNLTRNQNYFNTIPNFASQIKGISEEVKPDLEDILSLAGITVIYLNSKLKFEYSTWQYECEPLNQNDLDCYLPLFIVEISLYPLSLFKYLDLKNIFLVHSLFFISTTCEQERHAVPDYNPETKAMVYCCYCENRSFLMKVVHHELYHYIDYIDGKYLYDDPEWIAFNDPNFTYGAGGQYYREYKKLDPEIKGFLNFYSTTAIEEDKAEVFAYLMVKPEDALFSMQCKILQNKIDYMVKNLKRIDKHGFGGENYWYELLEKRRISGDSLPFL